MQQLAVKVRLMICASRCIVKCLSYSPCIADLIQPTSSLEDNKSSAL